MKNEIEAMITDITTTTTEAEDYTGEDGLLYCGKCHTPKEAYFAEGKTCFGRDRHPAECDCQRAAREKQQAAESRQKHLEKVEDLKRRGFTDPAMRNWTFEHDNGRNPQTETARFYVESWETMQAENIGYLFWGGVGTGKSYLAACIANALMEKEVAVRMTNFATISRSSRLASSMSSWRKSSFMRPATRRARIGRRRSTFTTRASEPWKCQKSRHQWKNEKTVQPKLYRSLFPHDVFLSGAAFTKAPCFVEKTD